MCLAIPGRVVSVADVDGALMAEVDFGTVRKSVCMHFIPEVQVGEYVIVHVGFAIQRLDEESALETLADFRKLGILQDELGDEVTPASRQAGIDQETGL